MVKARDKDINNELLIAEVRDRPPLYDKSVKEYSDANLKGILWEEVSAKVFSEIWSQLTKEQRKEAEALILRRWRNLRSAFTRELRNQTSVQSEHPPKRRKYKYYKELLFLLQVCGTKVKAVAVAKNEVTEFSAPPVTEVAKPPVTEVTRPFFSEVTKLPVTEVTIPPVTEVTRPIVIEVGKATVSTPNYKKKERYDESPQDVPRKRKKGTASDDDDPDRHFALSLVPMLKTLPTRYKLDAQIQILRIFRGIYDRSPPRSHRHNNRKNLTVSSDHFMKSLPL